MFLCKRDTKRYRQVFAGFVNEFTEASEKLPLELLNDESIKILKTHQNT
jgi:hypothetical protein